MQRLPGDVARLRLAQHAHHAGDVVRHAFAADWRHRLNATAGGRRALTADLARHHAVDRDAVWSELGGERLGEADDAHLAGADMGASGRAQMGRDPTQVDDASVFALEHVRQHSARAQKRAVKDDAEHLVPLLQRHIEEMRLGAHRRVVDQDIDAAETLDHPIDHRANRGLIGDIGKVRQGAGARFLDLGGGALRLLARGARIDDDRRPVARERERHGAAEPPHATGHDRDLSVETPSVRQCRLQNHDVNCYPPPSRAKWRQEPIREEP
jgi:hypothetical protein